MPTPPRRTRAVSLARCAFITAAALRPSIVPSVSLLPSPSPSPPSSPVLYPQRLTPVPRLPRRARVIAASTSPPGDPQPSASPSSSSSSSSSTSPSSLPSSSPSQPRTESSSPHDAFRPLRKLLTALAVTGCLEALYLTYNKLFSSPGAICATQGCLDVLAGPFSSFLGIPLSLFGALSYFVIAYLSAWPLAATRDGILSDAPALTNGSDETEADAASQPNAKDSYASRDAATRPLLLAVATVNFVFSTFLVWLLVAVIHSLCPYCLVSAVLSTTIFVLTAFVGRAVPRVKPALTIIGASSAVASFAAASLFALGWPAYSSAMSPDGPQAPPPVTAVSSPDNLRVAEKLQKMNTKMYGAYWCSHCYDQKQRFGKKAFEKLKYVECDKYGVNSDYQLCRQRRIPGYPTWEIAGELYPGEIDIAELERLVNEAAKATQPMAPGK